MKNVFYGHFVLSLTFVPIRSLISTESHDGNFLSFYSRYFCETLLDYQDPCPVKEQLRAKILHRLTKEGSTADEPANIALSDYSSLSSAEMTSESEEEEEEDAEDEAEVADKGPDDNDAHAAAVAAGQVRSAGQYSSMKYKNWFDFLSSFFS